MAAGPSASTQRRLQAAFALHQQGRLPEAEAAYRQLLAAFPKQADALYLLGVILLERGELAEAADRLAAALAMRPDHPQLLNALGETLRRAGEIPRAEALLRRALQVQPGNPDVLNNLGGLLSDTGRPQEAIPLFEAALRARPDAAETHFNLGRALQRAKRLAAAAEAYARASALRPHWIEAANLLGLALKNCGRLEEARAVFESLYARSGDADAASNLLLTLCYAPQVSNADLLAAHRRIGARYACAPGAENPAAGATNDDAPLRLGFVSGDFRNHALRFFIAPLLEALHAKDVPCFGYYNFAAEDAVTAELRHFFADFVHVESMSDEALAARIEADRIDVLVDLSGHTGHHRLAVFARRPAPVQVNWIGYLATTGLDGFDAHLTDAVALPPHMGAAFSEPLAYLPACQWCYAPPADSPPIAAAGSRPFTFGGLHTPAKLNGQVIDAWARILRRAEGSRLLLMGDGCDEVVQRFRTLAPDGEALAQRIDCRASGPLNDFLAAHNDVDLALDAFPYSGGTTTFHALWMGVPVLSLACDHSAGRGGASILTHLGMPDWIAASTDEYIDKAVRWAAGDAPAALRGQALRERLLASPLADGKAFAAGFLATLQALRESKFSLSTNNNPN